MRRVIIALILLSTSPLSALSTAAPSQEQNKDLTGAGLVVQMRFEALCKRALNHDDECKIAIWELFKLMNNPDYELTKESYQILVIYQLITPEMEVNIIMFKVVQLPHIQRYLKQLFAKEV